MGEAVAKLIDEITQCVDNDGDLWDEERAIAAATAFEAAARLAGAKEALEQAIKIAEAEGNRQTRISFAAQRACYSIWEALSRLRSSDPSSVGNEKEKP